MTRVEQYKRFNGMVADLLLFAIRSGIPFKMGEAWRTPEQAALNASKGVGSANSKHIYSLAIDLSITTENGLALAKGDDPRYKLLADFWVSQGGVAGYYFKTTRYTDPYHFEFQELPSKK